MRTFVNDTPEHIGEKVDLYGWVDTRRDHGKLIFIDIRDMSGIVQVVFPPKNEALFRIAETLRPEWAVRLTGSVKERPEKMVNPDVSTGTVEIEAEELEVLASAETPPFAIDGDGYDIGEEHRLAHRYIDLRRKRLQNNIRARHRANLFFRSFLSEKAFVEIETPYLTRSTPEGARDYVVPSRLQPGMFYALPQSPQQYKQLLMVGGFERYFQIARCFRDEDTRGDRQPEFTQLDIEMSFVHDEDILQLAEEMIAKLVSQHYPDKTLTFSSFRRLSYRDAVDQYGTDRPDLRKDPNNPDELAFAIITDFPMFEQHDNGVWTAAHHPFTLPFLDDGADVKEEFEKGRDLADFKAHQFDIVLNGEEIAGGSRRIHNPELLQAVFGRLEHSEEEINEQFGHMLSAFTYGVPPHGGIAFGLDRLYMVLHNEPSIREMIAFPKTGDGRDLMMNAPSEISREQLRDLHIDISREEE